MTDPSGSAARPGDDRRLGEATRALRVPRGRVPEQHWLAEPVWRSTAYGFASAQEYADALEPGSSAYAYSRIANPTSDAFAAAVAGLEGPLANGTPAVGQAFSSGMAAISSTFVALTSTGAHVVAPVAIYGQTFGFLRGVLGRFGVSTTFVDMTDLAAVAASITPDTAVLYAETISNPTLAVVDLPALARIAAEAGIPLVVDNTFASPSVCRPLSFGADIVLHSATKYIGGHSDATGGVAVGRPDLVDRIRSARIDLGGALAPDEAYLLGRGLQTLSLRVERQCATAMRLASDLADHPALQRVDYPGLADHPTHRTAATLFHPGRYGGVVTLTPVGGRRAGMAVCDGLRLIAVATSLGGTHSVVSHAASTTHRQLSDQQLAAAGIGASTVRISCGLEDADDLLADLTNALASIG